MCVSIVFEYDNFLMSIACTNVLAVCCYQSLQSTVIVCRLFSDNENVQLS